MTGTRPAAAGCRQCGGRPATALETIAASRHDNSLIAGQQAAHHGDGAHVHADRDGDMHVVRPIGATQ
ncbi:hypothetical protein [Streptomyces sp. NBC_01361]|uniref:hypothetical protein n=1 Tax=Streptomyces sp. NBC_01361 TaxID=2903838 RepID=UPI002E363554|nr:hypothetical protein [Streptomyces sp. NBC_01361]